MKSPLSAPKGASFLICPMYDFITHLLLGRVILCGVKFISCQTYSMCSRDIPFLGIFLNQTYVIIIYMYVFCMDISQASASQITFREAPFEKKKACPGERCCRVNWPENGTTLWVLPAPYGHPTSARVLDVAVRHAHILSTT